MYKYRTLSIEIAYGRFVVSMYSVFFIFFCLLDKKIHTYGYKPHARPRELYKKKGRKTEVREWKPASGHKLFLYPGCDMYYYVHTYV